MTKELIISIIFFFFLSGCSLPSESTKKSIGDSMSKKHLQAAKSCIASQEKIDSPILDLINKEASEKNGYVVQVVDIPRVGFYAVNLQPKNIYPDAPVASCRVRKRTGAVLSASYQTGEPGLDSDNVTFVEHDLKNNLSDEELHLLIDRKKVVEYSINRFLKEGGEIE